MGIGDMSNRCEEIFSFFVDKTVPAPEVKRSLLILIPFPDANTLSKVYVPSGTLTLTPIKGLELVGQYSRRQSTSRGRTLITPYTTSLRGQIMGSYPTDDLTS